MKTRWGLWSVVLLWCVLVFIISGCVTKRKVEVKALEAKVDAMMAMTNEMARRVAATEEVALAVAEKEGTVMPDILASVEPGSQVAWAHSTRAIRDEANKPLLDKDGNAQFETTQAVGKSRTGFSASNLKRGRLKLAGFAYDFETGKIDPNSLLEGSSVEILCEGGEAGASPEFSKVWVDAIIGEKTAILAGMSKLALDRGAAWAVKFNATTDGISKVLTNIGEVTGKILSATVVATPAGLAAEGVTKLVEAVIDTGDEKKTVLAADTANAKAATDCEGCVYNGE